MSSYVYAIPKEEKVFCGRAIDYLFTTNSIEDLYDSDWFKTLKEDYTSQYGELIIVDESTIRSKISEWESKLYFANPVEAITAEQFDYFLNVLPPLRWSRGAIETFFMSEFTTSNITVQYGHRNDRYIRKNVRYGDSSTYITLEDFLKVKINGDTLQS
jgi:hypothetical protein